MNPVPLRRWFQRVVELHVLFPAIAILALAVVWVTALRIIATDRAAAERVAATSVQELSETYEAQVVRALREIDQALRVVKYSYELVGARAALRDLKERSLLPADLLFVVAITDAAGIVIAATRDSTMPPAADPARMRAEHEGDVVRIAEPRVDPVSGAWKLVFSRGLRGRDGTFAGIVAITVEATHFVSAYESSNFGVHGLLAMIRDDGVVLAWRSGDSIVVGERVDVATVAPPLVDAKALDPTYLASWNGVRRFTSARPINGFPVTVVVGLSQDEQLAPVRGTTRAYLWRACAASVAVMLILALLWHMNRQLARGRRVVLEEQVANAARVEHIAYHDGLTGLANRDLFNSLLARSIRLAHRHNRRLAVLFLDLDRFKQVNDTLGHDAGDQLLQEVASRLEGCLRQSDTVARMGGDEFVALLPELEVEGYAVGVARKIIEAIDRPFVLRGQELRMTASVGISLYPADGLDEQALMKSADLAMYQAKAGGRNNFQFYSERMNADSLERLALEASLRQAVEGGGFELHYHAKRDIASGRITGLEALLRWVHPELGPIAPAQFIPIAEEAGFSVALGKWVLATACRQNVAWQDAGLPRVSMAVNLTERQFFDADLAADLTAILAEARMDASLLELEVAEEMLMRDVDKALVVMTRLKEMGVRIALDNFGIGYFSLTTLKRLPLDTIKIDRSFIRDAVGAPEHMVLAEAIIAVGRALSLTVVAQGVETREQAELLRRNSCDQFQGFYLDRPARADQIADLLRAQADVEGRLEAGANA